MTGTGGGWCCPTGFTHGRKITPAVPSGSRRPLSVLLLKPCTDPDGTLIGDPSQSLFSVGEAWGWYTGTSPCM